MRSRLPALRPSALLRPLLCSAALLGTPALAQSAPAPAPAGAVSAATAKAVSALAVSLGGAVKGQIVSCPSSLKLSPRAVCLYSKSSVGSLRPLIRTQLGTRMVGDWKSTPKTSTVLVAEKAGGPLGAFILLSSLSAAETLVVVDAAEGQPGAAAKPAAPSGVVKGQPYVLGADLVGVVGVTSLGGGKFRLSSDDQPSLTVTVGQRSAQTPGGAVELPLAPATDGRNLIFPLAGLRALGCTVTPSGKTVTVACGPESVGLQPIVF